MFDPNEELTFKQKLLKQAEGAEQRAKIDEQEAEMAEDAAKRYRESADRNKELARNYRRVASNEPDDYDIPF